MGRARVFFSAVAAAAALAALAGRAQTPEPGRLVIQANVGLPAVDQGPIYGQTHTPAAIESFRRQAIRATLHSDGVSSSGVPFKRGRMIVKFKDGASSADRMQALSSATPGGVIAQRPSSADFDIVNIDPSVDAEDAARQLSERPEV